MKLRQHISAPKRLLAVALVVLTFGLTLASSSQRLHQSLHRHCDESSCVVHLFAQGLVDVVAAAAILPTVLFLTIFGLPVFSSVLPGRVDFLLPPGRAPPPSCSVL